MHRFSRRPAVSHLLHSKIGVGHRTGAAAAQALSLPHLISHGVVSDVNHKWYSVVSGVNEAHKDDTLLGKLYESAGVESKEPTPSILLRKPEELSEDDYNEFYKKTFNESLDPLISSHFTEDRLEGEMQFRCILYVPEPDGFLYEPNVAPSGKDDIITSETKNIRLYVNGVLFSDDLGGQLLPSYLRFVKGVVDCNCFPLDVSNQNLQESRVVWTLRKWLFHNTLVTIARLSGYDYRRFWNTYGGIMKSGCIEDRRNHSILAPLLTFLSMARGTIGLEDYVSNMRSDQKDIYYIAFDSATRSARKLSILKRYRDMGVEVLILLDPLDEVVIQHLKSYKGKNFVDITKEGRLTTA